MKSFHARLSTLFLALLSATHVHSVGAQSAPVEAASVDLRPVLKSFGLLPQSQGARPTCSVFTVTSAIEFAAAKKFGQTNRLSIEFLNWAANQVSGADADGAFFSDLWKGFSKYGVCEAKYMPYRPEPATEGSPGDVATSDATTKLQLGLQLHWVKEWDVKTGLTEKELSTIRHVLERGWPVCGGFRWAKREQWIDQVLQMCPPSEVRDGHSVLLTGYILDDAQPGGGVFLFRNTSSQSDDGRMPFAYAKDYMNDAAWVD